MLSILTPPVFSHVIGQKKKKDFMLIQYLMKKKKSIMDGLAGL